MFSPIVCIVFLLCPTCSKNRHGLFVLQLKITNLPTTFCCYVQLRVPLPDCVLATVVVGLSGLALWQVQMRETLGGDSTPGMGWSHQTGMI